MELMKKFDTVVAPNNELLATINGAVPERLHARDSRTGALLYKDGEPVWLTKTCEILSQLQRNKRITDNTIRSAKDAYKKELEAKAEAREKKKCEQALKEIRLLEMKKEACDVEGLDLEAVRAKLASVKEANRVQEQFLAKRAAELAVAAGERPSKRRRGGEDSTTGASASSTTTGNTVAQPDSSPSTDTAAAAAAAPGEQPPARGAAASAAAAPKARAKAEPKAIPAKVQCQGMKRGGIPCDKMVLPGIRFSFCRTHERQGLNISRQQFMCSCGATVTTQGEHCAKCKNKIAEDKLKEDLFGKSDDATTDDKPPAPDPSGAAAAAASAAPPGGSNPGEVETPGTPPASGEPAQAPDAAAAAAAALGEQPPAPDAAAAAPAASGESAQAPGAADDATDDETSDEEETTDVGATIWSKFEDRIRRFNETYLGATCTLFGVNLEEVDKGITKEDLLDYIIHQCAFNCRPKTEPMYSRKSGKDLGRLPQSRKELKEQIRQCQACKELKKQWNDDGGVCNLHVGGALFLGVELESVKRGDDYAYMVLFK